MILDRAPHRIDIRLSFYFGRSGRGGQRCRRTRREHTSRHLAGRGHRLIPGEQPAEGCSQDGEDDDAH